MLTHSGTIGDGLLYVGGRNRDTVTTTDTSEIGTSLIAKLGAGNNTLVHAGHIGHHLIVKSLNSNDTVDHSQGTVDGLVWIRLGWWW